jgi:hypothetical protein
MTIDEEKILSRAWEYHKQLDILYVYRFSYAMVAQSMFVVSFTTLIASNQSTIYISVLEITIAIFGLIFTYLQYMLSDSLAARILYINQTYLIKLDPIYDDIQKNRSTPIRHIQRRWISVFLALTWAIFLIVALLIRLR